MAKNPYDVREIFDEMSLDLIRSMQRNFKRHGTEELKEGFKWEQWQKSKLREMQRFRKQNQRIVGSYGKSIDKAVNLALKDSYNSGGARVMDLIRSVIGRLKRILNNGQELSIDLPKDLSSRTVFAKSQEERPPEQNFFRMNETKLAALQRTVRSDMRKAEHAVLRKMDDDYRQTLYKAQIFMDSGAKSLGQAVDMATKDFLAQGINCIQYKDGKMANVSSYAEMALRTASQRATMMGEGSKRQEWGLHLVVVTAHGNTCKLCLPWQGKVLIDDVYSGGKPDGEHPLLSTAMRAGLLHPNCRHTLTTYFPGITELPKQPVDDRTALARYEAEQKQRAMERQVRKYKRLEAGSVDPENQATYGQKVGEWQGALRQHVKENDHLRRDYQREKVVGGLTAQQRSENLKLLEERGKLKKVRDFIRSDKQTKALNIGQQNKHIQGTNEYRQYEKQYIKKGQHGPSRVMLSQEELQELINKHAGTGELRFNKKGEWNQREIIYNNDKVIGKVVNNITGDEVETTVFKIHYGKSGAHIVPDYPSKKGGGKP